MSLTHSKPIHIIGKVLNSRTLLIMLTILTQHCYCLLTGRLTSPYIPITSQFSLTFVTFITNTKNRLVLSGRLPELRPSFSTCVQYERIKDTSPNQRTRRILELLTCIGKSGSSLSTRRKNGKIILIKQHLTLNRRAYGKSCKD